MSIDLWSNNLEGEIPEGISTLLGLISLNLSRNQLIGKISLKISYLSRLETLGLSHNHLSVVRIDQCTAIPVFQKIIFCHCIFTFKTNSPKLFFFALLSHLDLSYNNLFGRIPSKPQFQTLENSSYLGNPFLCGFPILTECEGDDIPTQQTFLREDN
ncbi:putative non-specific serine/threonine protein kinase [Rosa chinensis]|uniref:Putative non-specific serine/threonine protein kinase n=1 Tax=Rosa chinensis TaxID=74649 RepID=A0A2P6RF15_ROSCH|nr:putative non-specific serine/threonine protein kinase [Rosa chinensis]